MRALIVATASALLLGFLACSDDDGSDVVPNGPPGAGTGGSGGTAGSAGAGAGGGGTGGASDSGVGGIGGSAGCSVTPLIDAGVTDAGIPDAGAVDAGPGDAGPLDASTGGGSNLVSFASDIHPLFELKCAPCHVTDNSGGHNVGGELVQAYADAVELGATLVQRIDGGGMPPSYADPPNDCGGEGRGDQPGDEGCLTVDEVALVQRWIDQCYPR